MKTWEEMNNDEHFEHLDKLSEAIDADDDDERDRLMKMIPLDPLSALALETVMGEGYLRKNGYNLTRVDAFDPTFIP
jgi:hypothetical protein